MHVAQANRVDQAEAKGGDECGIHFAGVLRVTVVFVTILIGCTVARVTNPVVKIGLVAPFEGPYRYVGYDAIYAVRLALREANATGGVAGHSVELVAYDDRGTVGEAVSAARNLVVDSQVVAVIGHFRDATTRAALDIYQQAGIPLFGAGTLEGGISGRSSELLCPLVEYLRASRDSTPYRVQWFTSDSRQLACGDGIEIFASTRTPVSTGLDAVLITLDPPEAGESLRRLYDSGWDGVVVGGPSLGSPLFSQLVSPAGVIFASPYRWPEVEGPDGDFGTAYQSLGPHVSSPGPFALTSYETTQAVLAEIETAFRSGEAQIPLQPGFWPVSTIYIYRWSESGLRVLVEELQPSGGE